MNSDQTGGKATPERAPLALRSAPSEKQLSSEVWNRFWLYLDEHPEAGTAMRKLQAARCDPREIAHYVFDFVLNRQNTLVDGRRERYRRLMRTLAEGTKGARKAADACRALADAHAGIEVGGWQTAAEFQQAMNVHAMRQEADRLEQTAGDLEGKLTALRGRADERRLGQVGFWPWLVMLQEYARASGARISCKTLAEFIKAARSALRWKYGGSDGKGRRYVDAELLRKGIEHFRERNPRFVAVARERCERGVASRSLPAEK